MSISRVLTRKTLTFLILTTLLTPFIVNAQGVPERIEARLERALERTPLEARFNDDEVIVKFTGDELPRRVPTRGRDVQELIDEYSEMDNVVYAEPNYIAYAHAVPNDPYYNPYQWNFDNDVYGGVQAESAWDITTGTGVVVAVIDTGVAYEDYRQGWWTRYYQAPDLAGTNFVSGYDFVNNDSHANDDEGHGTHVTGTIAGTTNDGEGVAGLAYGATIMPIKVLNSSGSGSYADVADGIRFAADNGAQVINLSLGGATGASYLEEAVRYAYERGVTIVASAGNGYGAPVGYPASYDDYVIAVGATGYDEVVAPYSNVGSSLDIVAPGGDMTENLNGDGYSDGILQQTLGNSANSFGYYFYQGTSMAAPHVAAAAAMVISAGKADTPDEVRNLLESTADDLGANGRDNTYGHGLLNLAAALGGSTPPSPEPEPEPEPTPNEVPTANAGPNQTVTDNDLDGAETIVLDGTNSTDTDGTITAYEWYEASTHLGSGETLSLELAVGVHDIDLFVTDNDGDSSSDNVRITIEAGTPAPEPEPEPAGTLFEDGFETGLGSWSQDIQFDWKSSRRERFDGRYAAEVDGYAANAQLISPLLNTSGADVVVSFAWFIEGSLDSGEYIAFEVSTDGGNSWVQHKQLATNNSPSDVWVTESFTIETAGTIQIRFLGTMSSSVEDAYVDSVLIETL